MPPHRAAYYMTEPETYQQQAGAQAGASFTTRSAVSDASASQSPASAQSPSAAASKSTTRVYAQPYPYSGAQAFGQPHNMPLYNGASIGPNAMVPAPFNTNGNMINPNNGAAHAYYGGYGMQVLDDAFRNMSVADRSYRQPATGPTSNARVQQRAYGQGSFQQAAPSRYADQSRNRLLAPRRPAASSNEGESYRRQCNTQC